MAFIGYMTDDNGKRFAICDDCSDCPFAVNGEPCPYDDEGYPLHEEPTAVVEAAPADDDPDFLF